MKARLNFPAILLSFFFISFLFLGIISCTKDNDTSGNGMYAVSGNASGSQVVPSVNVTGTGTLSGTYNANTNLLAYTMAWTSLSGSATASAFYSGASGANGTLVGNAYITTSGSTGGSVGTLTLTDAQETALLNGNMYYIVTTPNYSSGEIRGQITAVAQ